MRGVANLKGSNNERVRTVSREEEHPCECPELQWALLDMDVSHNGRARSQIRFRKAASVMHVSVLINDLHLCNTERSTMIHFYTSYHLRYTIDST